MSNPQNEKSSPTALKVRYKCATVDDFIQQKSRDISLIGIFIETKYPLKNGIPLKFGLQLADGNPVISGFGRVVWCREDAQSEDTPSGMGIKFLILDAPSRSVVDRSVTVRGSTPSRFDRLGNAEARETGRIPSSKNKTGPTTASAARTRVSDQRNSPGVPVTGKTQSESEPLFIPRLFASTSRVEPNACAIANEPVGPPVPNKPIVLPRPELPKTPFFVQQAYLPRKAIKLKPLAAHSVPVTTTTQSTAIAKITTPQYLLSTVPRPEDQSISEKGIVRILPTPAPEEARTGVGVYGQFSLDSAIPLNPSTVSPSGDSPTTSSLIQKVTTPNPANRTQERVMAVGILLDLFISRLVCSAVQITDAIQIWVSRALRLQVRAERVPYTGAKPWFYAAVVGAAVIIAAIVFASGKYRSSETIKTFPLSATASVYAVKNIPTASVSLPVSPSPTDTSRLTLTSAINGPKADTKHPPPPDPKRSSFHVGDKTRISTLNELADSSKTKIGRNEEADRRPAQRGSRDRQSGIQMRRFGHIGNGSPYK